MKSTLSCRDALPLSKVEIVEKILHAFDVWPECMLCPKGVGFAEHVPAEKHLRALWEKLPTGKPVARGTQRGDIRDRQMDVLGGFLQKQPLRYAGEQVKWLNSKLYQIVVLITSAEPVCG